MNTSRLAALVLWTAAACGSGGGDDEIARVLLPSDLVGTYDVTTGREGRSLARRGGEAEMGFTLVATMPWTPVLSGSAIVGRRDL